MSENGSDRELVLGNKQLLAIFFVAALLCGVFFAVGYVVGGNSAKNGSANVSDPGAAQTAEGKRDEPQANASLAESTISGGGATAANGAETIAMPGIESRMADNPAAAGSAPPPTTVPVSATPAQTGPVTKASQPAQAPATGGAMVISVPEKGASYVQITAQTRPHADDTAKLLRDRGWPVILAESSVPDRFRVLVGPYHTGLTVADAKRKLTELGFGDSIIHKQ